MRRDIILGRPFPDVLAPSGLSARGLSAVAVALASQPRKSLGPNP